MREWTNEQLNAIDSTDGSVLVSAAAGSGKTAVLVERVKKMITREKAPVDADRLLVVTFTRDAAAEMKQRISEAINKLIEKDPYNPYYIEQKKRLNNAHISTIDSFCGDIVREYFHALGISSDYRIGDSAKRLWTKPLRSSIFPSQRDLKNFLTPLPPPKRATRR